MPEAFTNSAQIKYQYETASDLVSLETQTNYVTTNIMQNYVNVLKTANKDHFGPGEIITYSIFITNNSSTTLHNVEISEPLDEHISYVPNSTNLTLSNGVIVPVTDVNHSECGQRPVAGYIIENNISCNHDFGFRLNDIEPNSTILISFSVKIQNTNLLPDSISSASTLYYSSAQENTARLSISSNAVAVNKAYALLTATKAVDKTSAVSGETLVYTIALKNEGNINASNVHIIDALPRNFEIQSVDLIIADLPYKTDYQVDENNNLMVPASELDLGFCIPANSDDNILTISGIVT